MPLHPEIVTAVRRAPRDAVDVLIEHGVATAHEANARTGFMTGIRPVTDGLTAGGTAVTCLNYAGDNLMLHAAIERTEPGDVLVVGVTSPSAHGMFGEMLATSCRAHGIAAVLLDAGARDVRELREMRYPTWARHIAASGTVKNLPGWVNVPVSCGGQVVFPGDAIVADDDGVVVIGRADAAAVAERAAERAANEAASRASLATGRSTLDKGGRRELLAPFVRKEPGA
ncbi:MAG TPA: 4-carboxy-4-hydroxy-2-oxoadipate aldolase/oxaloacetate decarboxylase [Streptosporangiaceae bacterium]|jgi:4-hydroxy-4-methyl-2-oxoglutarate aldolase